MGIIEKLVEYRQVVAQRLAAGCRRHQNHVFAAPDPLESFGLVTVEARDAPAGQNFLEPLIDCCREVDEFALASRLPANRGDGRVGLPPQRLHLLDHALERSVAAGQRVAGSRGLNLQGFSEIQREIGRHG